jgi:Fic family protein
VDIDRMRSSPIGELVRISGTDPRSGDAWQYWAYVPAPLPATPRLGLPALDMATKAAMAVARLDQAVSQLPRPEILVRPIVRREAASTSALEGTYASFDEVLEADFLDDRQLSSEQREIRNYVHATEQAMALLETYPISRKVAGQLQQTIVRGTSGDSYDAGDIRQRQVAIGPKNRPIEEARFVPSPADDRLVRGVSDWERWLNEDNHVPIVAKMAMGHYQFETLHPFADGNGRLGRLIAILQLVQDGILRWPVLNLAPWLEQNRDAYQDGLLQLTETGDFDPWVCFFADAVHRQARDGVAKIAQLLELRDDMLAELRAAGVRGSALHIAENLIGFPLIDVPTARTMIGKTFEAANQAVARLVELGMLREITGRPQNRLFVCQRAYHLIQS